MYLSENTHPDQSQEPLIRMHQQTSLTSPSESILPSAEISFNTQKDDNSDENSNTNFNKFSKDNRTKLPPNPPASPNLSDPSDNISLLTPCQAMFISDILKIFADILKLGSNE